MKRKMTLCHDVLYTSYKKYDYYLFINVVNILGKIGSENSKKDPEKVYLWKYDRWESIDALKNTKNMESLKN